MESRAKKKRSPHTLLNRAGLVLSLALLVLLLTQDWFFTVSPLKKMELATLDMRFQRRGPLNIPQESLKVVIVTISQESFKSLPEKFPWPHWYYAHVIRNLKRAGVLGIGIDVVFEQADEDTGSDRQMVDAIRETHLVAVAGKTEIRNEMYSMQDKSFGTVFYKADSSIGIVQTPTDVDAAARRYQPMSGAFNADSNSFILHPSLSFATLNKVFHLPPTAVPENHEADFVYAGRHIPKADETTMYVNYYGPDKTFKQINFADVIDDSSFQTKEEKKDSLEVNTFDDPDIGYLAGGYFKGKVILIGTVEAEDKDIFTVPIGHTMNGVEIHANIIQNVIDNNFLRREPKWIDVSLIIILIGLTFSVVTAIKHWKLRFQALNEIFGALFIFMEVGAILAVSFRLFISSNLVVMMTNPMLAVGVGYIGATVYNYLIERKQKTMIKGMFTQYLSPAVVNQLVENPEKLRLGGERKLLTIFFSDIAGFTSLSEKSTPEGLVGLLNEYLSAMTEIIFTQGGTLDKYEGDAIMAFWGAPIDQEDHALRACIAALKMQEELVVIRERWKREGKPDLYVRIGLNSGEVLVGNMGGAGRFDYTVIGDSVNLASRLEGANKQYKSSIMLGQRTHELVKDHVIARELDMIRVVGKSEPITVYELIGMTSGGMPPKLPEFLAKYHEALKLHRQQKWVEAINLLEESLKIKPDDYPAQIYIERSRLFQMAPPPENWDGVFVLKSK